MSKGDVHQGLLKAIIEVMNEDGPDEFHFTQNIANALVERGYWPPGQAKTPANTVATYLSMNPEVFSHGLPGQYALKKAYQRPNRERRPE